MKIPSTKDIARDILRKYQVRASIDSAQVLADMLVPLRIRYRTLLQETKSTVTDLFYIDSGLIRVSHVNEASNTEFVDEFVYKGEFFVSSDLFTNKPAIQEARTIEPTICFALPYASLRHRASTSEEFNDLLCAILEEHLLNQQTYNDLLSLVPVERYTELKRTKPVILSRCPMKDVANYLRMRPETLSRIRTSQNS